MKRPEDAKTMALKPDGYAGQIAALKVGDSYSIAKRISIRSAAPDIKISEAREHLKNTISPHVARAKHVTGNKYTVETAVAYTHDYVGVIVMAVVTRL